MKQKTDEATRTNYAARTCLEQSEKFFGKDSNQLIEHFVLSERHPEANPLFLRLGDSVLLSPHFAEFFSYVLHAILDIDIFNKEVEKRKTAYSSQISSKRNMRNKDSGICPIKASRIKCR